MMGSTGVPDIPRYKSGRVDVAVLQSKTGHEILKGGQIYTKSLSTQLKQFKRDLSVELYRINYQMKLLISRRRETMKRSGKTAKNYDLPPIYSPLRTNVTPVVSPTINRKMENPEESHSDKVDDRKTPRKHEKLLQKRHQKQKFEDSEDPHRSIFSPAPMKYVLDMEDENTKTNEDIQINNPGFKSYPHITVQTCEEKLPPLHRQHSPPVYSTNSRPGSTQSLEIPSPVLKRRSKDGKDIIVLTPGNLTTSHSRSESSLHNVLEDPRFKALEAVLRPATPYRTQARAPKRTSLTMETNVFRTISRSVSPKPRITNRDQFNKTDHGSTTPP